MSSFVLKHSSWLLFVVFAPILASGALTHVSTTFPKSRRFDPDWFEGLGPPPFTYMTFGGGPQICLGMEFARTKMVVFLHHLVLHYEWSMVNPNEGVVGNVFQKGLPLKISKKQSLELHCRRLNKEWERRSCQVKCELRAVKKACVTDCALCVANMLGFSRCHEDLRLNILCLFSIGMHLFFEF